MAGQERRPSARQRGYTSKWEKARKAYLAEHPLCETCRRAGRITAATVVDHITPHRGDYKMFWDRKNWQPLCDAAPWRCHSSKKQSEERLGYSTDVGDDGWPIDPNHPVNRSR